MRGGPEAGARPGRLRGALERGGHRFVGARGAGGELPRALRVVLRQGARDGAMGVTARDDGGAVVGGGAQQRVAERDLARRQRDDPGALRALERRHVDARGGQRPDHDVAAARLGGGGDQQRAARVLAEALQSAREHALERRARRQRPLDGRAALELVAAQQRRDLAQRERVAAGGREHAPRDEVGHGVVATGPQELERRAPGRAGRSRAARPRVRRRACRRAGRAARRRRRRRAGAPRTAAPRATARRATAGRRPRTAPAAPRPRARAGRAAPRRSPAAPAERPARAPARPRAPPPARRAAGRAARAPARTARPGPRTAAAPRPPARACAARSSRSARSIAARSSAVLPIPGWPRSTSTALPPVRAVVERALDALELRVTTDQHHRQPIARAAGRRPSSWQTVWT